MENKSNIGKDADFVFKRIEKKYLLTQNQYDAMMEKILPHMQLDQFGLHAICNIYYDTEEYDLISRSIEKPKYKEKLRLRSYGVPDDDTESFIEIKKKYKGVVYKRREALPYGKAYNFLNKGIKPEKDSQILREISYFVDFYKPRPKLYLAYDREAYFGKVDSEVRMTFDHKIRYREEELDIAKGDYGKLLFDDDLKVLEIKVAGAMPLWLVDILSELKIYPVSFSKYGTIYRKEHAHNMAFMYSQLDF